MKTRLLPALILAAVLANPGARCSGESFWKGITKVKLENGLTVFMKEDRSQPLVTAQVWVRAGSVYENPKTYGLSHFLEHLIFKGTQKYPGDAISRLVETQGGAINAATSKEFTEYYIDIQKDAAADAVRILADAMANASFPAGEVERERLVVLEEMRRHEDHPNGLLFDMLEEAVYRKSPYKTRVIGTEEVIKNVPRAEIIDYYKSWYAPNNMVLALAGDFDKDKMLALVRETFGKLVAKPLPPEPDLIEPDHKPEARSAKRDVEYSYWIGAFLGPAIDDTAGEYTADVVSGLIAGGRSSRLVKKLREEKQLVYSIGSQYWGMKGRGLVIISAAIPPGKEKQAEKETLKELDTMMKEGPTDAELARVKTILRSGWFFGQETFHDQAATMGYWQLLGNPGYVDKYVSGVESVTKEDVKAFLTKYYAGGLNTSLITKK